MENRIIENKELTIGINAQIFSQTGGVEQMIAGLVMALGKLQDGNEKYILITHPQNPYWLKPYMGKNTTIAKRPWKNCREKMKINVILQAEKYPKIERFAKLFLEKLPFKKTAIKNDEPEEFEFIKGLCLDVIHFPSQQFIATNLPNVYNPHDLQHLHFPEFFSGRQIKKREYIYRDACEKSTAIAVASNWAKNDIIRQYNIDSEKIFLIPFGPPTELYENNLRLDEIARIKKKFRFPEEFIFYPAKTWPHKNHIGLLKALALLKEKNNLTINLVCSGQKNSFWLTIKKYIFELKLERQVRFIDFVLPEELLAVYKLAKFVVIPTFFEAGSFPMLEAFKEQVPVACSNVTSLPEQGGDAVLFFDPNSVEAIADAIYKLATDSGLRKRLIEKGRKRIECFSWELAAKTYRALYRKIAGFELSEEDKKLLNLQ